MNDSRYSFSPGMEPSQPTGYSFYEGGGNDFQGYNGTDNEFVDTSRPRRRVTLLTDDDGDRQSQNLAQTRSRSVGERPTSSLQRQMYQQKRMASQGGGTNAAAGNHNNGGMVMRNSFHRTPSRSGSMNGSFYSQTKDGDGAGSFYRNSSQMGSMHGSFVGGSSFYNNMAPSQTYTGGGQTGISRHSSASNMRQTSRSAPPPQRNSLSGPCAAGGKTYTRTVVTTQRLNARGEMVDQQEERFVEAEPVTVEVQQRAIQQQQGRTAAPDTAAPVAPHRRMQRPSNRPPSAGQRAMPLQRSLSRTMSMRGPMDEDDDGDTSEVRNRNDISASSSPGEDQEQRRLSRGSSERGITRPSLHAEEARAMAAPTSAATSPQPDAVSAQPHATSTGRRNSLGPNQMNAHAPAAATAPMNAPPPMPFFMPPQLAYATPQQQQQWLMHMTMMRNGMIPPPQQSPAQAHASAPSAMASPMAGSNNSGTRSVDPAPAASAPAANGLSPNRRTSVSSNNSNSGHQIDPLMAQQQQQQQLRMQQQGMYPGMMMRNAWGPPPIQPPSQQYPQQSQYPQQPQQQQLMMGMLPRGQSAPQRMPPYAQQRQQQQQQPSLMRRNSSVFDMGLNRYDSNYSRGPGNGAGGTSLYNGFGNDGGDNGGGLPRLDSAVSGNSTYSYGVC